MKINTDKTQLMVCTMPRYADQIENMEIETPEGTDNVKPQEQIKILGYLFNTRGNIDNQVNKLKSSCHAIMHIALKHRKIMPQAARKSYVYAHIISRINYILPFVAGHNKSIHKKIMDIWVMAAKFIYGKNTRKLSHDKLFERVGFPRKSDLIECAAASWMQKIIYTLEPKMIIDLVKFPRSRSICKISPKTKPNSARFKRTAINSAISCLNKADLKLTGLPPEKFKKGLKKVKLSENVPDDIWKDLTKITEKKIRPIINKKYPGADFIKKNNIHDGFNLAELYDPPECMSIEDRITEMEEHLNTLLEEEYI